MGLCARRNLFLSICVLQILSVVVRQVFDFLGFLWIPILVNFFEIIFVIFGFFGAYQYRTKYIVAYLLWHIFWLAWNIFIICLYLDVAGLDHENNAVLKLDPNSNSWWKENGPGCKVRKDGTGYEGCLVKYIYVEIFQAGLQCYFALLNSVISICLCRSFREEDDTFNFEKPDGPDNYLLHPMYVSSNDNLHNSNKRVNVTAKSHLYDTKATNSQKWHMRHNNQKVCVDTIRDPMRRSNSFNSLAKTHRKKVSRKSSRKNAKQRMSLYSIEFSSQLDNRHGDSDNDFDNLPAPVSPKPMTPRRVKRRSVMTRGSSGRHSTSSRRHSQSRSSTRSSRRMAQNPVTRLLEQQQKCQAYDSPASPSPIESPLPNYYSASNNNLINHQNWQNGHTNPTYQQSSQHSLNDTEDLDELYNNRPASVRSSYSNFHGTRALNYSPPKHYHSHATPQVPQKRNNPNRSSMRSMAFLNNGPPAYSSQSQIPVDSETPM